MQRIGRARSRQQAKLLYIRCDLQSLHLSRHNNGAYSLAASGVSKSCQYHARLRVRTMNHIALRAIQDVMIAIATKSGVDLSHSIAARSLGKSQAATLFIAFLS